MRRASKKDGNLDVFFHETKAPKDLIESGFESEMVDEFLSHAVLSLMRFKTSLINTELGLQVSALNN